MGEKCGGTDTIALVFRLVLLTQLWLYSHGAAIAFTPCILSSESGCMGMFSCHDGLLLSVDLSTGRKVCCIFRVLFRLPTLVSLFLRC